MDHIFTGLQPTQPTPELSGHQRLPLDAARNDPEVSFALNWWESFAGLPKMTDVSPFNIPARVLPRVILLDTRAAPHRVLVKLAGTQICEEWGLEPTGLALKSVYTPDDLSIVMQDLMECVDSGQPNYVERRFFGVNERKIIYRRLMLPLGDGSGRVTGLMTVSGRG